MPVPVPVEDRSGRRLPVSGAVCPLIRRRRRSVLCPWDRVDGRGKECPKDVQLLTDQVNESLTAITY